MYTRVSGSMALYFVSVSDTADFCTSSFFVPRTLALPVAVFDSDVLYNEAVLPPFFLREAPPRISSIVSSALFGLLIVVAVVVADDVVDVDCRDVKVIRLGWNDVDASTL